MPLLIPPKVAKEIRKAGIPERDWERLKERLQSIARNPRARHPGVKQLVGGGFRVEQGVWRAVYEITPDENVEVTRVGHRREVYR